jgi:hypothetical protein
MRRFGTSILLLTLAGCPDAQQGERCNPLEYSSNGVQGDCASGLACVYPTAPNCGVAYCCMTDAQGKITDQHPSCQPDKTAAEQCMLPTPGDAGTD